MEIKNAMSYLKVVFNPHDNPAFERSIANPTRGIGVKSQAKIREFVKYYNEQYNATFIITSHYMNDIDSMCKRVFVMNKGKGLYDGDFSKLIKKITQHFKIRQNKTIHGIGDDSSVLDFKNNQTLVSSDMLVEGIHFDLAYMPLKHLGYKSVMVNLSDIYAMNGKASHILVSIAISNRFTIESIQEIYKGIETACKNYNVDFYQN